MSNGQAVTTLTIRRASQSISGLADTRPPFDRSARLAHQGDGARVGALNIREGVDGESGVSEQSITQRVQPAMDRQPMAARPGVLNDRRFGNVQGLLDDIQLAEAVGRGALAGRIHKLAVHEVYVADVTKPVVDEPELVPVEHRTHSAAAVVPG